MSIKQYYDSELQKEWTNNNVLFENSKFNEEYSSLSQRIWIKNQTSGQVNVRIYAQNISTNITPENPQEWFVFSTPSITETNELEFTLDPNDVQQYTIKVTIPDKFLKATNIASIFPLTDINIKTEVSSDNAIVNVDINNENSFSSANGHYYRTEYRDGGIQIIPRRTNGTWSGIYNFTGLTPYKITDFFYEGDTPDSTRIRTTINRSENNAFFEEQQNAIIWIADNAANPKELRKYENESLTETIELPSSIQNLQGITYDNGIMWLADHQDYTVVAYDIENNNIIFDKTINTSQRPHGITLFDNHIWILEKANDTNQTATIRAYNRETNNETVHRSFTITGNNPQGIAHDGEKFWIAQKSVDEVIAYNEEGERQNVIHTDGSPQGIVYFQNQIYISNSTSSSDSIEVYDINNGNRDNSKTINLGNIEPSGITIEVPETKRNIIIPEEESTNLNQTQIVLTLTNTSIPYENYRGKITRVFFRIVGQVTNNFTYHSKLDYGNASNLPDGIIAINKNNKAIEIINNDIQEFKFGYNRSGGNGNFTLSLRWDWDRPLTIDYDYSIAYVRDGVIWYRGIVNSIRTTLADPNENIVITGSGISQQLNNIQVTQTFRGKSAKEIIIALLDRYLGTPERPVEYAPNITYNENNIEDVEETLTPILEFKMKHYLNV